VREATGEVGAEVALPASAPSGSSKETTKMMLTQAEIDSLRQEAKESMVQIKAYLKQLREEKAQRAIAASANANIGNENGQQSPPTPDTRTSANP
jgi:hypothetical protein